MTTAVNQSQNADQITDMTEEIQLQTTSDFEVFVQCCSNNNYRLYFHRHPEIKS